MTVIDDLLIEFSGSLIWFVLGVIALRIYQYIQSKSPVKKLWRINSPKSLIICVATSTKSNTGTYTRPATGIGQVRAIGHIIESINKAYNIRIRNIILSMNQVQNLIEKDIILLGGPKNNSLTKLFLDKVVTLKIVNQTPGVIHWLVEGEEETFTPTVIDRKVKRDYGLIIRMKNPFDSHNRTYIASFSGCHTYGTTAASKYFTELYVKKLSFLANSKDNVFIVVKCDVIDGYPVGLKLIKKHEF